MLKAGLAAGVTLSPGPSIVPRCSGALKLDSPGAVASCACVDMIPHFDHHQTINFKTNTTPELRLQHARAV